MDKLAVLSGLPLEESALSYCYC